MIDYQHFIAESIRDIPSGLARLRAFSGMHLPAFTKAAYDAEMDTLCTTGISGPEDFTHRSYTLSPERLAHHVRLCKEHAKYSMMGTLTGHTPLGNMPTPTTTHRPAYDDLYATFTHFSKKAQRSVVETATEASAGEDWSGLGVEAFPSVAKSSVFGCCSNSFENLALGVLKDCIEPESYAETLLRGGAIMRKEGAVDGPMFFNLPWLTSILSTDTARDLLPKQFASIACAGAGLDEIRQALLEPLQSKKPSTSFVVQLLVQSFTTDNARHVVTIESVEDGAAKYRDSRAKELQTISVAELIRRWSATKFSAVVTIIAD